MHIPWYAYLFMLCIGSAAVYAGISQRRKTTKLLKNGIKAEGEVIELVSGGSTKNTNFYYPVIQFETLAKESITHKYDVGGSSNVYPVGDKLTVIYEQENPSIFMIDDKRSKLAGTFFTVAGIIVLAIALLLLTVSLLS
jgi:Protein of unknown function (DUF3592)